MKLDVTDNEAQLLSKILTQWLGELRTEIRHTDGYQMREELRQQEEIVKALIARLEQLPAST